MNGCSSNTLNSWNINPNANMTENIPDKTEIIANNLENSLFLNSIYPKPRLEIAVKIKNITAAIACNVKKVSLV